MAETDWQKLTLEEKVEDLRRDMVKTMNFVNHIAMTGDQTSASVNVLKTALGGIAAHLDQLESKVPKQEAAE